MPRQHALAHAVLQACASARKGQALTADSLVSRHRVARRGEACAPSATLAGTVIPGRAGVAPMSPPSSSCELCAPAVRRRGGGGDSVARECAGNTRSMAHTQDARCRCGNKHRVRSPRPDGLFHAGPRLPRRCSGSHAREGASRIPHRPNPLCSFLNCCRRQIHAALSHGIANLGGRSVDEAVRLGNRPRTGGQPAEGVHCAPLSAHASDMRMLARGTRCLCYSSVHWQWKLEFLFAIPVATAFFRCVFPFQFGKFEK